MWLAFDIIVHLCFGESTGCVENGMLQESLTFRFEELRSSDLAPVARYDDWADVLHRSGFHVAIGYVVKRRLKLFQDLIRLCLTNQRSKEMRAKYVATSRRMAAERLAKRTNVPRFDIFSRLITDESREDAIDLLTAQAGTLAAGGTETTSSAMGVLTYYLLKNPQTLQRLQDELRTAFTTIDEITGRATQQCEYLNAVIEEGLRICAPIPFGLPRVVPPGGATIAGEFIPEGVSITLESAGVIAN